MLISLRVVGKEIVIERKPKSYLGEDPAGRGSGGGILPSRLMGMCCAAGWGCIFTAGLH